MRLLVILCIMLAGCATDPKIESYSIMSMPPPVIVGQPAPSVYEEAFKTSSTAREESSEPFVVKRIKKTTTVTKKKNEVITEEVVEESVTPEAKSWDEKISVYLTWLSTLSALAVAWYTTAFKKSSPSVEA